MMRKMRLIILFIFLTLSAFPFPASGSATMVRVSGRLEHRSDEYYLKQPYILEGGLAKADQPALGARGGVLVEAASSAAFGELPRTIPSVMRARERSRSRRPFIPIPFPDENWSPGSGAEAVQKVTEALDKCAEEPEAETTLWGAWAGAGANLRFKVLGLFCYDASGHTKHGSMQP